MTAKPVRKYNLLKSAAELAAIVLVVVAAKTAIAEPFYVPSGSMEPTLLIGDELLATKFPYGYGTSSLPSFLSSESSKHVLAALPRRGDVVVFRWPGDQSQVWVKRVIGLPGDRIMLERGRVFINGEPVGIEPDGTGLSENENGSQSKAARFIETLPGGRKHTIFKLASFDPLDNVPETVVPAGHLFVMGDNRDNSADSRVPLRAGGVGMLPVDNLVGRVDMLIGSWDLGMKHQPIWTWPKGLRLARFFTAVK
ncbi:MAG: signal peptidase I [Rhodopseudomonas sp.]|nr:signal peptidase I [Rhodopseudomonas sp.]